MFRPTRPHFTQYRIDASCAQAAARCYWPKVQSPRLPNAVTMALLLVEALSCVSRRSRRECGCTRTGPRYPKCAMKPQRSTSKLSPDHTLGARTGGEMQHQLEGAPETPGYADRRPSILSKPPKAWMGNSLSNSKLCRAQLEQTGIRPAAYLTSPSGPFAARALSSRSAGTGVRRSRYPPIGGRRAAIASIPVEN